MQLAAKRYAQLLKKLTETMKIYLVIFFICLFQLSFGQKTLKKKDSTKLESIVEVKAIFPGGEEMFKKYISSNIRLPEMSDKVSGEIRMQFTVGIDGNLTDIKLVKNNLGNLGLEIAIEATKVLKSCPKWIPANRNGIPISMTSEIPLKIGIH